MAGEGWALSTTCFYLLQKQKFEFIISRFARALCAMSRLKLLTANFLFFAYVWFAVKTPLTLTSRFCKLTPHYKRKVWAIKNSKDKNSCSQNILARIVSSKLSIIQENTLL